MIGEELSRHSYYFVEMILKIVSSSAPHSELVTPCLNIARIVNVTSTINLR